MKNELGLCKLFCCSTNNLSQNWCKHLQLQIIYLRFSNVEMRNATELIPQTKGEMHPQTQRNVILGILKAHYNIVKTRASNVNCGNINAIAMEPSHA